jgi:uncharacterized protein (TIGR02246 family)
MTRTRALARAALALLLTMASAAPAAAQDADEQAVDAVVTTLFEAMAARDAAAMATLFAADARFAGLGRNGIRYTTAQEFMDAVASATGPAWIERTYDREIRIDGALASVWAYYTFHLDEQFSHCGYDAFQMLKVDGAWKIVHLADSRRAEGCTHTTP